MYVLTGSCTNDMVGEAGHVNCLWYQHMTGTHLTQQLCPDTGEY